MFEKRIDDPMFTQGEKHMRELGSATAKAYVLGLKTLNKKTGFGKLKLQINAWNAAAECFSENFKDVEGGMPLGLFLYYSQFFHEGFDAELHKINKEAGYPHDN